MRTIDFKKKNISQFRNFPDQEKKLVRNYFNNKGNGFYVDVGANEPIFESQTYHLEQLGWQGLLIEPLYEYSSLLKKNRNAIVMECACSSPENHEKMKEIILAGGHSTLNSKLIARGSNSSVSRKVICKTLDSILENNKVPIGFDFISIDIEGHEMEMLSGFNLAYWKPKLVLMEDHVINHYKHNHMIKQGYQLILRTGLNSWYVPKTFNYKLSILARLEYLRKYWVALLPRKIRFMK